MKFKHSTESYREFNMASIYCFIALCICALALADRSIDNDLKNEELVDGQTGLIARIKGSLHNENRKKRSFNDNIGVAPDEFDVATGFMDTKSVIVPELVGEDATEGSARPAAAPAPQFMLDLFKRFEQDPSTRPTSNIIRSFSNLATQQEREAMQLSSSNCDKNANICVRKHLLLFNVSSILSHEEVKMAELRLYKIVERDRRAYVGVDRKVEVVEITCGRTRGRDTKHRACVPGGEHHREVILDSKHIYGRDSGWETFNITSALQRWIRTKSVHQLQINIETINYSNELTEIIDIEPDPASVNEPLLIVFSDDSSRHHRQERKDELAELIRHHQPNDVLSRKKRSLQEEEAAKLRVKRHSSDPGPCRVEPMYLRFSDINYDSWIVNPSGYYPNVCVGTCNAPYQGQNPTTHVVIQGLLNAISPETHQKPCCVPTKLEPISLLYRDKDGTLVYKYKFEDMKVAECGCR